MAEGGKERNKLDSTLLKRAEIWSIAVIFFNIEQNRMINANTVLAAGVPVPN
jgi:hypothetical protein